MKKRLSAYEYGVKAFMAGMPCIPARDTEFLTNLIAGLKVGEGLPYIKEWHRDWVKANLSQLVEQGV